jgi:low affinity Fe/Cu permease
LPPISRTVFQDIVLGILAPAFRHHDPATGRSRSHATATAGTPHADIRYGRANEGRKMSKLFAKFATAMSEASGKPVTFVAAVVLVLAWAISGPVFHYSETWQLVINTSTTIVTFLMVFILQNSQNRDGKALQAKLDELIIASQAANRFVGIEKLEETQLKQLSEELAEQAECVGQQAEQQAEHRNHEESA